MYIYLEHLLNASILKYFSSFPKILLFILFYLNVTLEINEIKWSRDRKFFTGKNVTTNFCYAPIQIYYSSKRNLSLDTLSVSEGDKEASPL